jgi:Icc protein
MTQIAHLSDLHLLEPEHAARQGVARRRLAYLTLGRPNDAVERRRRAVEVLAAARRSGADHVVITGDLTEDGIPVQFDILAEVLAESRLPPSQVTLIAGNHDAYVDGSAFERALRGPLSAYAATSTPGVPVVLRDATILPVCTAFAQPYTRSAGAIDGQELEAAAKLCEQSRALGRALVLAMHHPPHRRFPVMQWIDGLVQYAALGALLERHDHVHVLHGHTHATADRAVRPGATPRIFSTESVIDSHAPLRFYHARHGRLWPAALAPDAVPALAVA